MIQAVKPLGDDVGKKAACEALEVSRATFYRHLNPAKPQTPRPQPPLALSPAERQRALEVLHSERFQDRAPLEVYATLLDEGCYLCSPRTMYRILDAQHGDVKERRRHVQRPTYGKPELLATGPNQLWSWDISVLQQRRVYLLPALREKLHKRWRNRPSEVCLQGPASNHPQRHRSKALVVSVEGKGVPDTSGMDQEGEHP